MVVASFVFLISCGGGSSRGFSPGGKVLKEPISNPDDSIHAQAPPTKTVGNSPGGGPGLDGGETNGIPSNLDDESTWEENVVEFTDPRNGETYSIIDGRVLVSMKDPAPPLELDPNYFDNVEEVEPSPEIYPDYPPILDDPRVQQFLQETGAVPFNEWVVVRAFAVFLPEGTSVAEAVSNWPTQYSDFIEVVDPDTVADPHSFPQDYPNDYLAQSPVEESWHLWGGEQGYEYGMNVYASWQRGALGGARAGIAVIDHGVQRVWNGTAYEDLYTRLTLHGANVGSKTSSTSFAVRGGDGWAWVRNRSSVAAQNYGHGQMVTGSIASWVNNDSGSQRGGYNDVAGIMPFAKVFPIAMKYHGGKSGDASTQNTALEALGAVTRMFDYKQIYFPEVEVPRYYIEVASISWGQTWLAEPTKRHLDRLTRYMFFVASAGNENTTRRLYPAAWRGVHAIAAYTSDGYRASYSNYGNWIFVAGPTEFYSTDPTGAFNPNPRIYWPYGYTDAFHQTAFFAGTSASAPAVAGLVALLLNYEPNRGLTPTQVEQRLRTATVELPNAPELPGRLDAEVAVFGQ